MRNVGVPDISPPRENAGAGSFEHATETAGKNRRGVGFAVTVTIFQKANAVLFPGIVPGLIAQMLPEIGQAVFDRHRRQIVVEPVTVVAVVLDSLLLAIRLGD